MNLCREHLLAPVLGGLRTGEQGLLEYAADTCEWIAAVEEQVQALVPEEGRRDRLIREAGALRNRYPVPADRPPLFGALVGVKDIFRVEGLETRAGSRLPPGLFAGPQAECVAALRRAGALVLGKTWTTEFAYFEPAPTRNPRHPGHTPGGSSSGSAAAVAAGYCPVALGTQTVGSVIRPAAFCGVVGFKPSFGRISTAGLVFFSTSADHVGLFTQDVAGMRLAAAVLCPGWQAVETGGRPMLGVPEGPYLEQASAEGLDAFARQVRLLREAGYAVRSVPVLADIAAVAGRHRRLIAAEMAQVHAAWFARHEPLYRPRTAALIREGQQVRPEDLEQARLSRAAVRAGLEQVMQVTGIDLWVCPAAVGPAPEGLDSTGDPAMNLPWTHAGMPALGLPAGRAGNGLPLGLQCVARFGQDERLLAWAGDLAAVVGM